MKSEVPVVESQKKMFAIRAKKGRQLKEAFLETEEFFLGISSPFNSQEEGVFNVAVFSKDHWVRG